MAGLCRATLKPFRKTLHRWKDFFLVMESTCPAMHLLRLHLRSLQTRHGNCSTASCSGDAGRWACRKKMRRIVQWSALCRLSAMAAVSCLNHGNDCDSTRSIVKLMISTAPCDSFGVFRRAPFLTLQWNCKEYAFKAEGRQVQVRKIS